MPETRSVPSWAGPGQKKGPGSKKSSGQKTLIGIGVVVVAALAVGAGLTVLNNSKPATGGPGGGPGGPGGGPGGGGGGFGGGRRLSITVGTAKTVIGQIPITLDALGTVTPPVTATITTRIAGELTQVNFKEGQMVRKGQLLAQIDPRPYKVALEQAEGTLARDQALLANARLDLKRYQTLLSQDSISSQQVDTQTALVNQDQGVVASDQGTVDNAKLNLAYTSITAPVAGRVGLRQVDVGNYVNAGSTTGLVVITVLNPIDVLFSIPEDNIPKIMQRQKQGATLVAAALNRDGGAQLAQGSLSTLDAQIDTSTGTVKAKARFDNANGVLFPQQFVNIHLLVDTICNAVVVPTTAVRHGAQGDYVFTVQPDNTAKVEYVKVGPGTAETVSILTGLSLGDVVITDGGDRLRDGSPVTLPGKQPPGAAAGGGARAPGQNRGAGQNRGQGGGRNLTPEQRARIAAMTPAQRAQFFARAGGGQGGGRNRSFNGPGGAPPPPAQAAGAQTQSIDQGTSCDAPGAKGGVRAAGAGGQGGRGPFGKGGRGGQNGQGGQGGQGPGAQGPGANRQGFNGQGRGRRPGQGQNQPAGGSAG